MLSDICYNAIIRIILSEINFFIEETQVKKFTVRKKKKLGQVNSLEKQNHLKIFVKK